MTSHALSKGMIRAATPVGTHEHYMPGFGNDFETEALPGALPQGMNSPQKCNYGLYGEQLSGTAFTAPSHQNERTWCYRIRPSVKHTHLFEKITLPYWKSAPHIDPDVISLGQYRWDPVAHSGEALPYRDAFLAREVERDQIDLVIHRQEILIELWWTHDGSTLDVEIHPWAEDLFESRGLTPSRLFLSVHALLRQLIDTAQPKRGLFLLEDAQFDESSDPAWRDRLVFLDRTAIG